MLLSLIYSAATTVFLTKHFKPGEEVEAVLAEFFLAVLLSICRVLLLVLLHFFVYKEKPL